MDIPRVAFVTGAARGIGRACAEALADRGFALVLNDLSMTAGLGEAAAGLADRGVPVAVAAGDISDTDGLPDLASRAWTAFGRIDCLVNNAGISVQRRGDILQVTPDSLDRVIAVNLRGTFFLTQSIARMMIAAPADTFRSIITISSANAVAASPDRAEYCLAKSALGMMTKLFALRLAAEGVHTYEVRPGVIRTEMTAVRQEHYDRMIAQGLSPINRWGAPQEVGRTVATLAAAGLPFSTGEVVHADGGLLVARL